MIQYKIAVWTFLNGYLLKKLLKFSLNNLKNSYLASKKYSLISLNFYCKPVFNLEFEKYKWSKTR